MYIFVSVCILDHLTALEEKKKKKKKKKDKSVCGIVSSAVMSKQSTYVIVFISYWGEYVLINVPFCVCVCVCVHVCVYMCILCMYLAMVRTGNHIIY